MLDAARPPVSAGALTAWPDHADERRWWLLPGPPRLAPGADGAPSLSLAWVRDAAGAPVAGFLQGEVHLDPTEEALEALHDALLDAGVRLPELVRPTFTAGTARLLGWLAEDAGGPLVARPLVETRPSLDPSARLLFAHQLSGPGALLLREALAAGTAPAAVVYELETPGLAGPLGVTVQADLSMVFDRFEAQGALNTPMGQARIAGIWEELAVDRIIDVTVVDETGDVATARAEALRRVGEDLMARLFTVLPPPPRAERVGNLSGGMLDLSVKLDWQDRSQLGAARWDFRERRARPVRHRVAATLSEMLAAAAPWTPTVTAITGTAPAAPLRAVLAHPLAERGVDTVVVEVVWGAAPEAPSDAASGVLTDETADVELHRAPPDGPWWWRVVTQGAGGARTSAWQDGQSRVVVVSLAELLPERRLDVAVGPAEADWLAGVAVTARCGDLPPQVARLDGPGAVHAFVFQAAPDAAVALTARWLGLGDEPDAEVTLGPQTGPLVVLESPFAPTVDVLVVPNPAPGTEQLVVTLESQGDGWRHARTVELTGPAWALARVPLRRRAEAAAWTAQVTVVGADGSVEERPPQTGESPVVLAGLGPAQRSWPVRVVLPLGSVAEQGLFGVQVSVEGVGGGPAAQALLQGEQAEAGVQLVLPAGRPLRWTARISRFSAAGTVIEERVGQGPLVVI